MPDADKPVGVAGVMGGADTEVDNNTVDILLESAHFEALSVRRASRLLKLRTEASYRFERVVDPEGVQRAVERACQLLAEIGQPQAVPGILDVYPQPYQARQRTLRVSRAVALLGMDITTESATDCLKRLGFGVTGRVDSDVLNVEVPTFRPDITLEEDLIEEVGRIYGYENIPETLPLGTTTQGRDSAEGRLIEQVKHALATAGLQEVVTHSLTAPAFFDSAADAAQRVEVRNALSAEISGLRRTLAPTLLDVARHNAAYQQTALALFEVGRVWQWPSAQTSALAELDAPTTRVQSEPTESISVAGLVVGAFTPANWQNHGKSVPADFYTARGLVEQLASRLGMNSLTFAPLGNAASALPLYHPGRSAHVLLGGKLSGREDRTDEDRTDEDRTDEDRTDEDRADGDKANEAGSETKELTKKLTESGAEAARVIGVVGEIHPRLAETLPFQARVYLFELDFETLRMAVGQEGPHYTPLPRFPAVTRDLAPRLPLNVPYQRIEAIIARLKTRTLPLLTNYRVTDRFVGAPVPEGQKSLTLSFTFRAADRTMTEGEVNDALGVLREALETEAGAVFVG